MMRLLRWLLGKFAGMVIPLRGIFTYRRTIWYLLRKRGVRAVYNFPYIKSFVMAGGEGTAIWLGDKLMEPLFRLSPQFAVKLTPYPFNVEIEITTRCNKRCIICEASYWKDEERRDLFFKEFKKIVDQFPKLKWVNFAGEGDPFLNKDFLKMIGYLKSRDILVFFDDSFDFINEGVAEELIRLGVDGIWVSWDGATKETYEKIKVGCSFEKGLNNIGSLIELKKKMKSPIPEICFRYIVTTLNVHEMPQFIELVHSLGDRNTLGDGSRACAQWQASA